MTRIRRMLALCCVLLLLLPMVLPVQADAPTRQVTVLFTHDLHSHLLPAVDETGATYGGYAQLKTVLDAQRAAHPDAIYVDAGDFSMGSLFQTSFRTSAVELRVMGALGVDVTTFGNHEYDYGPEGLGDMLHAALDSGDPLPAIVETNFWPPDCWTPDEGGPYKTEQTKYATEAMRRYGVEPYLLLERGGVWFGIFSAFGEDAESYSPTSGMLREDSVQAAKRTIQMLRARCKKENGVEPIVICLSHSGTKDGKGEDVELARKVDGIDLLISGHSHTTLEQPIVENGTYIVSAGEYAKNLGVVTLDSQPDGEVTLADYKLIPIDGSVPADPELLAQIEAYKAEIERDYLHYFGVEFDEVLVQNPYRFESVSEVYATQHESPLGNLIADAYLWAAEQETGTRVDLALTASGVIRETIPQGEVKVSDVFECASLGNGRSELPGGVLLEFWLTGRDLRQVLEVDASVQPIMSVAQLFCSGVEYTINRNRMFFNRIESAALVRDGVSEEIDDEKLYHVVTGTYAGNMLGSVKKKSFGLLEVVPRHADGTPIDMTKMLDQMILREDGSELKEWDAIARYLQEMGGTMDGRYAVPDGRKTVYASWNPAHLLRNANKYTAIALGVAVLLCAAVVLVAVRLVRRTRRKRTR